MVLFCTRCRGRREFEQPPCDDGHGPDCPDLACVECGLAVFAYATSDGVHAGRAGARGRLPRTKAG